MRLILIRISNYNLPPSSCQARQVPNNRGYRKWYRYFEENVVVVGDMTCLRAILVPIECTHGGIRLDVSLRDTVRCIR